MRQLFSVTRLLLLTVCTLLWTHLYSARAATPGLQTKNLAYRSVVSDWRSGTVGTPVSTSTRQMVPDQIVVKLNLPQPIEEAVSATGIPSLDARLVRAGVRQIQPAFPFLKNKRVKKKNLLAHIYYLQLDGTTAPQKARALLEEHPLVVYAEPLYLYRLQDTPDDPLYSSMSQFPHIQAPDAWDIVKGEQGNVVVAIVDGGTDWDHLDLLANVWVNPGEIPANGVDDDNNGFVDDVHGWNFANNSNDPTGLSNTPGSASHGTHVAGTAAAVTNNALGVASISWNCQFMPINAAHPTIDRSVLYGFDGIVYAAANGADIVNCSWGGTGAPSRFEQEVIDFAHANGTLVVAAAGNGGNDQVGDNNDLTPHYPSNYHHVLAVGATQKTSDQKASFSNYGVTVDVFAPGVNIYSTTPNNTYSSFFSGTSMASPLAAGLAALVKTLQPAWNVDQVREQVRVTCDPIDAVNPGLGGLLGKGRINAFRAVSEFNHPAIRIAGVSFVDAGGNGIINAGEVIDVTVDLTNFLAMAGGVTAALTSPDNNISILSSSVNISSMSSGDTLPAPFQFQVAQGVPDGYVLRFYLDLYAANGYVDRDFFQLVVNPPQVANHNTGLLQTSVTTQGNIGFVDFAGTAGAGFVFNGQNYLFEGGLMVGTGVSQVSDCIRGSDGITQDDDFRPASGEVLTVVSPGNLAYEEGSILLVDSLATNPLGLSILQESFADTAAGRQEFIVLRYTLANESTVDLHNVFVGLFFDWDIRSDVNDYARWDEPRRMGYVMDASSNAGNLAATKLLTRRSGVNFRAIDNPNELYDGFTDTEKWDFLSGGIQTQILNATDVSTLLSEGPFFIPAGQSIEVAFAVIGANSLTELQASADRVQALWDSITTDIQPHPEAGIPQTFALHQNFPNPFNPETVIGYALPEAGWVKLTVFDLLGRTVNTLVHQRQPAGAYQVRWNGLDRQGRPVPSGVYLYQLKTSRFSATRKMLLLR